MSWKGNTLYKKNSNGQTQFWRIRVEGQTIIREWGILGGTTNTADDVILEGKCIGTKLETTPTEQAIKEARALHLKRLKKGYVVDMADALEGKVDRVIKGGVSPMLAHRYDKYPEKITWPAYAQPKLDGHRCIAVFDECGKVTLWSRTRKPITGVPHIVEQLESMDMGGRMNGIILDGELYQHGMKFEDLTGLVRSETPKDGYEKMEYHVYDLVSEDSFSMRWSQVWVALNHLCMAVRIVPTYECETEVEMWRHFGEFTDDGYEGLILRNMDGAYKHGRSYNLQKVKRFNDAEFEITDVVEGRGKMRGHAIFECTTSGGDVFMCKMKGEMETLQDVWANRVQYLGKVLTVQYQGMTDYGIPRFPVGLRVREDV